MPALRGATCSDAHLVLLELQDLLGLHQTSSSLVHFEAHLTYGGILPFPHGSGYH